MRDLVGALAAEEPAARRTGPAVHVAAARRHRLQRHCPRRGRGVVSGVRASRHHRHGGALRRDAHRDFHGLRPRVRHAASDAGEPGRRAGVLVGPRAGGDARRRAAGRRRARCACRSVVAVTGRQQLAAASARCSSGAAASSVLGLLVAAPPPVGRKLRGRHQRRAVPAAVPERRAVSDGGMPVALAACRAPQSGHLRRRPHAGRARPSRGVQRSCARCSCSASTTVVAFAPDGRAIRSGAAVRLAQPGAEVGDRYDTERADLMDPHVAPCGAWISPLSPRLVAAGASVRIGGLVVDRDEIYWVEARPDEGGRNVVVRRTAGGAIADVTPSTANVRTRVHEYGGAAFVACRRHHLLQRVHRPASLPADPGRARRSLDAAGRVRVTPMPPSTRVGARLVCVREESVANGREPTTLVSVSVEGGRSAGNVIVSGHDFYASPRFNRDGLALAWLAWRHPQMPWDGTELLGRRRVARRHARPAAARCGRARRIDCSTGLGCRRLSLDFVSDRSGWWNLYFYSAHGDGVRPVCPMDAECGRPMWQLGRPPGPSPARSRIVVAYARKGRWRLGTIDLATVASWPSRPRLSLARASPRPKHTPSCSAVGRARPDAVVRIDLATGVDQMLRTTCALPVDRGFLSEPEAIEFPSTAGTTAHAFFYKPANRDFVAPTGERPPLIVICHGGPTAAANARLTLEVQYWTSRGFAVVDVNYGGSASYGRAYRRRLFGQWGVVDVADAANAARHLITIGEADPHRVAIRGRSAGGYTTLAALVFESDIFKAGASYYGIGDLELLAQDTHKFESHYLDGLLGPYPEARALYRARSPIDHLDRLSSPLILFQGLDDRVVPPNQAHLMADAVRRKGLPVALLTFAGEQHGFRRAETIVRCLEAELSFYGAVFGFVPPDTPPLAIDNL